MDGNLVKLFEHIDKTQDEIVSKLAESVAIRSISGDPTCADDCVKVITWGKKELDALGFKTEIWDLGTQKTPSGAEVPVVPTLFGSLEPHDPQKNTLLVYGHLDVQPADKSDGWHTEPFTLVEKDGQLFGRGSTDDKGPIVAWMAVVAAFQKLSIDIPVNLLFVLEGMEESGSVGLDEALKANAKKFESVDYVVITDNYWLGKTKPCLTYGLRGICYYHVEIFCSGQDLHSGVAGGVVPEAMVDLVWLLSQLVDGKGKILVPGLLNLVDEMGEEEEKMYKNISFDVETFQGEMKAAGLLTHNKEQLLQNRWRNPSLSIHGIEGAFSGEGSKTVIPGKVVGKFSIRIVPSMTTAKVNELVVTYLQKLWTQRGTPNKMTVNSTHGGPYYLADPTSGGYAAAASAIKQVFGSYPDYTREGGSIPVATALNEVTGKQVVLLPLGASDDMAHSQNEKMNRENLIKGAKVLAAYLFELAHKV